VGPQSQLGYVQLGNLRFVQKQYNEAAKAYQDALDRDSNSTDALRGLMNTHTVQKQVDQAVAAVNAQIVKSPSNSGFYDLLGTALFHGKKDLSGAEAAFTRAIELDKNNSDALIQLGEVQAAEGKTDQAIATYQQAMKDHPGQPSFYVLLGELFESRKDWSKAANAFQNALALKPTDPIASNRLANVMLASGGNLDVALSLAQNARRGLPDSPNVADTLGWVYYQKGAYQSAIDFFHEALKLAEKHSAPDDPRVHYHLGLAYEKTGQPGLASQQLERALKINSNFSDAADARKQLAQLHS
jgi:tetratricopeptide (TPR) repeat protein